MQDFTAEVAALLDHIVQRQALLTENVSALTALVAELQLEVCDRSKPPRAPADADGPRAESRLAARRARELVEQVHRLSGQSEPLRNRIGAATQNGSS